MPMSTMLKYVLLYQILLGTVTMYDEYPGTHYQNINTQN
jgi:hypothetical protein